MAKTIALILLFLSLPLWPILYILVKTSSVGPFIFKQRRMGMNKRPFTMYKIRTMVVGAHMQQKRLEHMNEADGPVFKIRKDPRYTKIGAFLARSAVDELPQLINVIKGEMAIVGPRPLPVLEAKKIPENFKMRFSVLPGMTSLWIISGGHRLKFKKWMELDLEYIEKKSFSQDVKIFAKTISLVFKTLFRK